MSRPVGSELKQRIDAIEEAYEFMLAYAAQGLSGDEEEGSSATEIRKQLQRSDEALDGLSGLLRSVVEEKKLQPAARYEAFVEVVKRDARDAQAAIHLVLAQRAISSQLIDNLNALIHVRALLTDLFLVDEVLKLQEAPADT